MILERTCSDSVAVRREATPCLTNGQFRLVMIEQFLHSGFNPRFVHTLECEKKQSLATLRDAELARLHFENLHLITAFTQYCCGPVQEAAKWKFCKIRNILENH